MNRTRLMHAGLPSLAAIEISGENDMTVTATGTNQATAYAIQKDNTFFTTVAASTGAVLPVGEHSDSRWISNHGANALSVYPPVGGFIGTGSQNAALSIPAGKSAFFINTTADGLTWAYNLSA